MKYKVVSTTKSNVKITAYCDDLNAAYALADALDGIVLHNKEARQ